MREASHLDLQTLRFAMYTSSDIRAMSSCKVITSMLFDQLGHPLPGGLYDSAMGPFGVGADPCSTCGETIKCPGHPGHTDLCTLVYNPVLTKTVLDVLRFACLSCSKLQISDDLATMLALQLRLIDAGHLTEAQDLDKHMCDVTVNATASDFYTIDEKLAERKRCVAEMEALIAATTEPAANTKNTEALRTAVVSAAIRVRSKVCIHCKEPINVVKHSYGKLVMVVTKGAMQAFYEDREEADRSKIRSTDKPILPDECRQYLRQIYDSSAPLLRLMVPVLAHSRSAEAAAEAEAEAAVKKEQEEKEALAAADSSADEEVLDTVGNLLGKTVSGPATGRHPVDIFFSSAVPITPSTVRPANKLNNAIVEHPQTTIYKSILEANATLRAIMTCMRVEDGQLTTSAVDPAVLETAKHAFQQAPGDSGWEKMHDAWHQLQLQVNRTWDSSVGRNAVGQGLKQGIEKKSGWIRMYTMGKRVNFAARTVITPDPYLNVDEIGIPDKFAKKLSYPVPVTAWNVAELRAIVMNGPEVYPGANYVENERGFMQMIPANNATKRESMAKMLLVNGNVGGGVKIVHRHLVNGDVLLLNRQPSLHRPSIMAHKARILRNEKTFRLHYSNCKSYNADFDGDEMNAHCPQNELGRAEGYHLANVSNHYLVPKDGTPLGGLIQDQVIAGVKISTRGRFFNREDYQQLVFAALGHKRGNIRTLPPAILKPTRLWSGKQIFSTILLNLTPTGLAPINLRSTAKIGAKSWQVQEPREWLAGGTALVGDELTEAEVVIRGGELMVGVMDKTHYGATPYGLIHSMYELYGGNCSTLLLSSLTKLFTVFLQREGFTLGVHDILVLQEADKKRAKIIKRCRRIGNSVVAAALGLPEDASAEQVAEGMAEAYNKDAKFRTILDRQYKSALDGYTNSINQVCLPAGLLCKFPDNNLQLMVGSGAKGSTVNTMQISCLLGQIELEGKRPPLMISGKSLPSFAVTETSPKSGGFIDGRFLTGIQPQEFFFHCMAGREGLIDTAVKTSRSGYLQRCLIKHLEGLNVNYDLTVRDSDNSVVQFMYGEDGLDIAKAPYLRAEQLAFLDDNAATIVNAELLANLQNSDSVNEAMSRHKKALRSWVRRNATIGATAETRRTSSFLRFSSEIRDQIDLKQPEKRSKKTGRRKIDAELVKIWRAADADKKADFARKCAPCPDPVFSTFKPDNHYGSVSEYFEKLIGTYVKARPDRKREFTDMMCVKSMRSFAAPGEPVGLLAAQSIGEPSTQMTLNTFHFAGRGEMNVTLGIPRLREILMMASANIKTPSMDIPFKPQPQLEQKAEKLRLGLVRVTVHDVLESINVKTSIVLRPSRAKVYKLRFNFLPRECYKDDFGVRPRQVIKHMGSSFFKFMFRALIHSAKAKYTVVDVEGEGGARGKKDRENFHDQDLDKEDPAEMRDGGDSSDEEAANDEDDATAVKLKSKNVDECDYDEPEVVEEIEDAGFVSDDEEANAAAAQAAAANGDDDEAVDGAGEDVDPTDVVQGNTYASNYVYDREKHLWCELTFNFPMQYNKNIDLSSILKDVARKSVIAEVPLIKRAITYNQKDDLVLKTDGINIAKMFEYTDLLDINRLYTNDIHAMARTYGIEAAARVIVKEVQNVFNVYGITVDPRHLLLIADYMTFDGSFKPMSRRGMESSASPLQQMSFESSVRFLRDATISGRLENLDSPSSRLMVGQPCKSGTGAFTLLNNASSEYMLRMLAE